MKHWWKIIIGIVVVAAFVWLFRLLITPQPGVTVEDQGRQHISQEQVATTSGNPPTSGSHLSTWVKAGVYSESQQDGELIHSLEHGYVIISYKCEEGCETLIKQLTDLANRKKQWKLIVVPRPQLDTTIALTAWDRIDTFDKFDAKRIELFIDYWRDQGPEKTTE